MSSLKSKFLYQLTASVLHAFLPIITFPYVTRVLGPERLGAINFVDYTAQIFITLANFGIPLYAVREIAKVRDKPEQLQRVVSELLSIHMLTTLLSLISFLLIIRFSQQDEVEYTLILLASLNIFFNAFSFSWFAHGLEDFKTLTFRSLGVKIFVTILVFLLIREASDFNKYYALLVGGSFMMIAYDIFYLRKRKVAIQFSTGIKMHISPLFIFFLTSASISLYTLFDTYILGILTTTLAVGFYTTALKIIRLFQSFINSLGGVLLPRIAYLIEMKKESDISQLIQKSILFVFTMAVPAAVLFYLLAPEIISVLAGDEYVPSIPTLQILSLLPVLIGLSNVFGIQILIPYKREKQLLTSAIVGSIVSVVLCITLSPMFKENGAALATIFSELFVTLTMGVFASRIVPMRIPLKPFLKILFTTIPFFPLIFSLRSIFDQDLVVLILSLILSIIIFCVIQIYFFSNTVLMEMLQFASSFLSKLKHFK